MEDFTGGAIHDQPRKRSGLWTVDPPFDARVKDLVRDWGANKNPELIEEMIVTALKMARDEMGVADLKLINRSLKEMRYAAKVFAGYSHFRKVVVFGSARVSSDAAESKVAEGFARTMVSHDYMVITGGGEGIMGAAQRGAGRDRSFGLNIRLPFEQQANEVIEGDPMDAGQDTEATRVGTGRGPSQHAVEISVAVLLVALSAVVIWDNLRIGAGWLDGGPQAGYFPLRVGDKVRFERIDTTQFHSLIDERL